MEKKYMIAGAGAIGLVGLWWYARRAPAPVENSSGGFSTPTLMYAPASPGGGAMADMGLPIPDLEELLGGSPTTPTSQTPQEILLEISRNETLSKIGSSLTPGSSATLANGTLTITDSFTTLAKEFYNSIGRATPDAGGLAYWTSRLRSGENVQQVQTDFLRSASTFKNNPTYAGNATLAIEQLDNSAKSIVTSLYSQIAGKTGSQIDSTGQAYWTNRVQSGESIDSIKKSFSDSVATVSAQQNAPSAVQNLYAQYAGKTGAQIDQEGQAYWQSRIDKGESLASVTASFKDAVANVNKGK